MQSEQFVGRSHAPKEVSRYKPLRDSRRSMKKVNPAQLVPRDAERVLAFALLTQDVVQNRLGRLGDIQKLFSELVADLPVIFGVGSHFQTSKTRRLSYRAGRDFKTDRGTCVLINRQNLTRTRDAKGIVRNGPELGLAVILKHLVVLLDTSLNARAQVLYHRVIAGPGILQPLRLKPGRRRGLLAISEPIGKPVIMFQQRLRASSLVRDLPSVPSY